MYSLKSPLFIPFSVVILDLAFPSMILLIQNLDFFDNWGDTVVSALAHVALAHAVKQLPNFHYIKCPL